MNRLLLLVLILLTHCSFDNKTGIWKNENDPIINAKNEFKDFKKLNIQEQTFDKLISPPDSLSIKLSSVVSNLKWSDKFYQNSNNYENYSYNESQQILLKSRKLSKYELNETILFDGANVILSDIRGNIIFYSLKDMKILYKYNFYKKKYKRFNKKLDFIIENNIIYISDNLGFTYAINYVEKKLLWARNFKIPFRSNLKIVDNNIFLSDQDNSLFVLNKITGSTFKTFPTEQTIIKNSFGNSLASAGSNLFFLNTFGSLYAINTEIFEIKWFINLNQSVDLNPVNLFYSNTTVFYKKRLIISSDPYLYILNSDTGRILNKISILSISKPLVSKDKIFLITKNNLFVCIDVNSGKIIYSVDINQKVANFLDTDKKKISIKTFALLNNKIFIFLKNSYVIKLNITSEIDDIFKLPIKIDSLPFFANNSIYYLNKNKLVVLN